MERQNTNFVVQEKMSEPTVIPKEKELSGVMIVLIIGAGVLVGIICVLIAKRYVQKNIDF